MAIRITKKADSKSLPFQKFNSRRVVLSGENRRINVHTTTVFVEAHPTCDEGEDGVILAESDVATWNPLRSTLTDDDVASEHGLIAVLLHAQALALAVATILDASLTFLMSHKI